ncbi:MAG: signal peptide peptidase SppA [Parabacteroides sp.]
MKQFFKMMFASALGVLVAIGVCIAASVCVLIGIISSVNSTTDYHPKSHTILRLQLSGTLQEEVGESPVQLLMGENAAPMALRNVLEAIRIAKETPEIEGIYCESGLMISGAASRSAIRRALEDFRTSGKFIYAYGDTYTQGNYYLCSVADSLFLNPQGVLELTGISSQHLFYKGLLEKVGVKMQIFKVGTYKGAVEPYMLDKLSDANREQIQSYIDDFWSHITQEIAASRQLTAEAVNRFVDEGISFADPKRTVELGLTDGLKYRSEMEEFLKKRMDLDEDDKLRFASVDQVLAIPQNKKKHDDQIAVLYAEGEIAFSSPTSYYDNSAYITEKMADELIKLRKDKDVKAVVFRVNSPGGSAYISDQIWKEVVELKKVKPVVVSMGDVAASGGYYISCAANKIVAEANTLTGSIGIFGMFPDFSGLLDKLDVTTDIVKTNRFSDMGDTSRPMTDEEKALLQTYIERGYDTFISRCAEGRGMTKEQINAIGQGRVWTGSQALERGLVDELGGIDCAIRSAAELADLKEYSIKQVSTAKDFLTELLESQWSSLENRLAQQWLGEDYTYVNTLRKIRQNTGIQARIPYDMKPL